MDQVPQPAEKLNFSEPQKVPLLLLGVPNETFLMCSQVSLSASSLRGVYSFILALACFHLFPAGSCFCLWRWCPCEQASGRAKDATSGDSPSYEAWVPEEWCFLHEGSENSLFSNSFHSLSLGPETASVDKVSQIIPLLLTLFSYFYLTKFLMKNFCHRGSNTGV